MEKIIRKKIKIPRYMEHAGGNATLVDARIILVLEEDHSNKKSIRREGKFFKYLTNQKQLRGAQNQIFLEGDESAIRETFSEESDWIKSWNNQALFAAQKEATKQLLERTASGKLTQQQVDVILNEMDQQYTIPQTLHLVQLVHNSYNPNRRLLIFAGEEHFDDNLKEGIKNYAYIAVKAKIPLLYKLRDKIFPQIADRRRANYYRRGL